MSIFDEREAGFEASFVHDEEKQFQARMRRNRFMAVWASGVKGDTVEKARNFALELIKKDIRHIEDDDVLQAVLEYLGDAVDEKKVRHKMSEMMAEAKEQIASGI